MVNLIRSCKLRADFRLNSKLYLKKDHAETRLSIYSIDSWISIDILSVTSRTKEPWNKSDKSLFLVIISYFARLRLAIYEMNTLNSDLSYTYKMDNSSDYIDSFYYSQYPFTVFIVLFSVFPRQICRKKGQRPFLKGQKNVKIKDKKRTDFWVHKSTLYEI